MLVKAEQKFVRVSPRKLRLVAGAIRGLDSPDRALSYLESMHKHAAAPLAKVIKQAVANARNNLGLSDDILRIKELQVNEGAIYKRWHPASRGRMHPRFKRTSHIRVILEAEEGKKKKAKKAKKVAQKKGVERAGASSKKTHGAKS